MRKITSAIIIFFSFSAITPAYARNNRRVDIDIEHRTERRETGMDKYAGVSLLIGVSAIAFGYFINSIANFRGPEIEKVIVVNPNQNNPYDSKSYSTINPQTKSGQEKNNNGKRILVNRENTIPTETKPTQNNSNIPNILPRF